MITVAIIGCGKIADQHVHAIARLPDCKIVAVCDREHLMAQQLAERFRIGGCYADAAEMLQTHKPDVVHITTPPQGHFSLAKLCLEAGAHVYLEKPFTVNAPEAEKLIEIAERTGKSIVPGHNYQFTPEMCAMRRLVAEGYLGGPPVHIESHFPYDLGDKSYVGPLLASRKHWVRQLPGQLLQNIISHGIAKLAEFLDEDIVHISAVAHASQKMISYGGAEVFDELRVTLRDRHGTTAYFCFSSSIKPGINQLRLCGPKNSILVDQSSGSIIRVENRSYKSYLTYFLPPLVMARQYVRNARHNITSFIRRRLYQDFGMAELIGALYKSIRERGQPPIPYREILLTARIMDNIFSQVYPTKSEATAPSAAARQLV